MHITEVSIRYFDAPLVDLKKK